MEGNLGNMRCFRRSQRLALYQGTTFSRAVKAQTELGFSPCAFSLQIRCTCRGNARRNRPISPGFSTAGAKARRILNHLRHD